MENDIQKLYDVLSRDGYYTKSFQEFTKQFEDDSYKQKVYDATSRDGLYTKSYEEFISKYSLKKKDVSEVSTSGLEPGVSVSGETDDIFKNDYLLGIREGSIKKDSGEIFNSGEVIDAAKEQGYSQEDIDKMMIKTSSDPTLSKEVVKEPKVEEVPSDLEDRIYQGIYGKALEQGDTSVPTIEQWKENPDLYTGMTSEEATEEALEMVTDPERADQAVEDIINTTIIPALKNVEHAYDETFIGDAIRTISMGNNKELKQLQIDKKKEKIQADTTLTEEQKENKIQELNSDGFVWASEPFVNLTGYTPEETNEFAVGIMSTVGDFMLTPGAGLLGQAGKLVPKVLTSKILLKTGKATQEVLTKLFKMSPDVASKIVQKQLPEFLRRADIAGTKFGTFNIYKDFQQQVDEYGGVENIDFSQSDEAFTEGYGLGVLLGTVGSVSRALPRAAQAVKEAGVKGVAQRGVTDILSGISPDKSVLIGRLGEGLAFTTEVGAFGLINATTPTLKNPEGELTTESFLDGSAEAFKTVIGFRAAGIVRNLMTPTTKDFKFEYDFNKSEKQKASDLVKEIGFKVEEGNLNPKEYLKDVIAKKKAPISVIDRVLQELSGMKSTLTRDNILKKVFKVEVQAKSDGTFDLNTYNKEGNWLTTRNVTNVGEARESIESFNQERLEAPQGAYEPNVEVVMNLDPIQDIISPPTMQFKIPRIDESPIDSPKPVLFNQPNPEAAEISSSYIEQRKDELGLVKPEAEKVESLDIENSKKIADAYDELVDNPTEPAVKSAYDAMAKETLEQYASILDKGYKIEIWEGEGEPYKNSSEMIADVRDNKHMYIFGTEAGFGEGEITPEKRAENAMLSETEYKDVTGKTLLVNDVFRFVHDFFGHTELGNGFGPIGEENAWMVHSRMYSPEARRAMTTETRGQNSWVNFNKGLRRDDGSMPKRGDADYIPLSQRPFAEQKMGLLPDDVAFPEGAPVEAQAPVEAELGELEFYRAGKTDPKDLDPEMAKDFAKAVFLSKDKDFVQGWDKNKKYGEGDIKRIKIDIKNPFDTNNPDTWDAALKNKIFTRKQLETLRDRGEYLMEVDGVPEANYMQPTEENNWLIIEQKGEALKNAGYDSFYVYEKGARNVGVFNKGVYSEVTEASISEPTTDVLEIKIPETRYNDPKEIERIGFETGGVAHIPTDFMLNFLHVGEKRVKQYTGEEIDLEIKGLKESLESGGVDVSKDIQYSPNRLEATRMIANSIRKDGFTGEENNIQKGPILLEIDSRGFARIGQGNHRLLAAKALGMDKVPVTVQFTGSYDNTPRVNKIKVISDSKIKELESIAKERNYHTKYASIWLTDLVKDNFIENNPVDLNKNLEGGYNLNEVISKITEAPTEVVPVEVKPSASLPIQPTEADAKMIEDMKAQGLPPLEIVLGLQESYIKQLPEGQPPMNEVALRQKAELILEGHENPEMTEDYFDMAAEMSKGKKGNIYDVINYLKKGVGRKLKKNFKPEGAMPRDAYTKDEFRVGAINKEIKQAEFNIRKLKKAVDKYNKANPDNKITYNDLNEYLSSYKYGIDPASRKGEVRGDSPRFSMESDFLSTSDVIVEKSFATKEARDEYLKGKDISKYDLKEKKLSEGTSRFYTYYRPEVLPDDIRIPLNKIRFHIDGMSNQLVEQGIVSEKLALTISSNLGSYIHRTFDAFEKGSDRSYEWVRENEPNNFKLAANYFRRRVAPEVRKENPDLKGTELNKAIIDRVETEMKLALSPDSKFNMLNQLEKQFKEGVNRSILDGQKDVSALKTRQFVPDDLRGYLGEVGNINNNYLESTLAIARILHNHQYQSSLKEMFSGKVFFDNAVDVPKDMLKGDEAPVQMETTNQDIVDPLAGMWTTPEMKEAFSGDYAQMSGIVSKALAGAIGIHKVTQTVMSYPSHAVNFFGNLGYLAANDILTYKMKSTGKAMLESAKASWVTMGGEPSPELEGNYLEYVEMGIVGTSASAKDILKYVGDSQMITENPELYGSLKTKESVKTLGDLAKYPGKGLEALAKLWGAEDDFFKIIGYEVAKDKRLDIYMRNGMSEVEAKRKIADEVKSEMPTFSRLPKAFRDVKGVRIVGTWLTYPVISLYSQIGTFSNAVDLVRNGKKWNEPELEKQGRRKAATGMGFVGLASLLGASISAMFGEEDEEDYDNARFFVRDYQQDSDIFVSEAYGTRNSRGKIDGGKMVYYDFGASNPYGSTQKIMNIWLDRFESIDEISAEEEEKMLKEMFNQVGKNLEKSAKALGIDADPVTATVLEALTGFDGYGKRLYEVEDKLLDKAGKGLSHILKRTMTPGSIRYAKKLTEAEDVKSESLAQATGVKRREVNLLDEMQYASFKFGSDFYQARKELRKKMRQVSKGEMTMDEYKSIAEEKSAFLKDRVAQMHAMYMGAQSLMLKGEDGIRSSDKQDIMDTNTALQRKMILEGGLSREVVKRFILPNDYYDIISRVETEDSFDVLSKKRLKTLEKELGE